MAPILERIAFGRGFQRSSLTGLTIAHLWVWMSLLQHPLEREGTQPVAQSVSDTEKAIRRDPSILGRWVVKH